MERTDSDLFDLGLKKLSLQAQSKTQMTAVNITIRSGSSEADSTSRICEHLTANRDPGIEEPVQTSAQTANPKI